MNDVNKFAADNRREIARQGGDADFERLTRSWFDAANRHKYSYHFEAFGRPIIQYPQDMVIVQELIWTVRPDLVVETGIAHGGSLIMSAGMLAMLDYCDAVAAGTTLDPAVKGRKVIGIDIDIRDHNRKAIEAHPLSHKIDMIEGSSVDRDIVEKVEAAAANYDRVLVMLDSNHTHDHVLKELEAYAPLTSQDSYCVVFDTVVEDMESYDFSDRPWGVGDSPKTAVHAYLEKIAASPHRDRAGEPLRFQIDKAIDHKLMISVAPDGFLKRI